MRGKLTIRFHTVVVSHCDFGEAAGVSAWINFDSCKVIRIRGVATHAVRDDCGKGGRDALGTIQRLRPM